MGFISRGQGSLPMSHACHTAGYVISITLIRTHWEAVLRSVGFQVTCVIEGTGYIYFGVIQ